MVGIAAAAAVTATSGAGEDSAVGEHSAGKKGDRCANGEHDE